MVRGPHTGPGAPTAGSRAKFCIPKAAVLAAARFVICGGPTFPQYEPR